MKLLEYQQKRDEARTNEPFGTEPAPRGLTTSGAFVVHLHDASRRHFDLRIEAAGVLASFAVPKGPSLDPAEKRLSVRTEDHPIEYTDFEAVIPDGNYGAGPMILWDRGRIRYLDGPVEEGLQKGKVDFELWGYKLRGRFALVRIKGSKTEWLFFKKPDAFATTERDPVVSEPRSVLSGLKVEELGDAAQIARSIDERAAALGAPEGQVDGRRLSPMLCAASSSAAADAIRKGGARTGPESGWIYELKLDGVRAIATKLGRDVTLIGRTMRDSTATYPEIARAVQSLAADRAVLDGEIVAIDETGKPNFQRLGQRIHLQRRDDVARAVVEVPVMYVVFDLIAVGPRDLRSMPLRHRKELLRLLLPAPGVIQVLDDFEGDPAPLLEFCRQQGLEGIVAKQKDSPYRPGPRRGGDWVKIKCEREADFVVVGYTAGEGGRGRLGALDVASFSGPDLRYRGKVGSGLEERTMQVLLGRLDPLRADAPVAGGRFHAAARGRTHVRPEIVVSVRFLGWSDDGHLRHPVFRGIRDDIDPAECTAAPHQELLDNPPAHPDPSPEPAPAPEPEPRVAITNPRKVLWPDDGFTKEDLCRYYDAIAPVLLPFLRDRPVVLVRYPDGIQGKHFFQWNAPPVLPTWVRTLRMRRDEGADEVETFLVQSAATLVYLANLAAIPIHVLACRVGSLEECDFFTIDFDIGSGSLSQAIGLSHTLRELLTEIGLTGFPKTSGQSGLHVFVPLGPGISFTTARTLGELLGRLLVRRHPDAATMERTIARRGPRVYVDTGQTGRARTIVAPYAVRAYPGATVSTPLHWEEVADGLDPARFTILTVPERVGKEGDLMAGLLAVRPDVPQAVARLGSLVGAG